MVSVVDRNIRVLIEQRRDDEEQETWTERLARVITRFTGSITFVFAHLVIYGIWIAINLPWSPWRFDPTFVVLAMEASVEAIFLSTFILITQNRMQAIADRRSDLDLQISLLSEHEITRLIQLVKAIAEKTGVEESKNPELDELAKDVKPENVLEQIKDAEKSTKQD
jgi:uncharacterized membrane protein